MHNRIGEVAGLIWQNLGQKGPIEMRNLPTLMKLKSDLVYQGLGWLARENKIEYQTKGNITYISLTESERKNFQRSVGAVQPSS